MRKIGITGGIGSGKSLAASIIAEKGFPVLDADDLTKELWDDPAVVRKLGEKLRERGYLQGEFTPRAVRAVAQRAFLDMQLINLLETVLQPMILEKMKIWLSEREKEGATLVFVVVPLLFECGLQYLFDATLTINVQNEIRERRLQKSRPLSAADINLRFNRQWANWARSRYATYTIDNDGTVEELRAKLEAFLSEEKNKIN
ncbi:dephospho-CoA kinase [bacterium]|nr:dephospho-CoA kinase [bacterium]